MPTYNYKSRELIAKVVYYGPGRCGKTTNLQQVHAKMRPETKSDLLSVATETDRTIYFDLLPLNLGTISGMKFMVRLFTVPGQIYYGETRKLVLKGADGVVFVADSQNHMLDENRQSLQDLKVNLQANGLDFSSIPLVMQWNKRDLPQLVSEAELDATLNGRGVKSISAVASNGQGVLETLRHITLDVFNHIKSGGQLATGTGDVQRRPRTSPAANAPAAEPPRAAAPTAPQVSGSAPSTRPEASSASPSSGASNGRHRPGRVTPRWSESVPNAKLPPKKLPPAPEPGRIDTSLIMDEFQNLAVMQGQVAERVARIEAEVKRLGVENRELREILASRD